MSTLSFHAPKTIDAKIRAAAKKRRVKVSRYLLDIVEQSVDRAPLSNIGRELEKLAIDSMALAALGRIRSKSVQAGADKFTPAQLSALVKATRQARA